MKYIQYCCFALFVYCAAVYTIHADTLTDPSATFHIDNATQNTISGVVVGDPYSMTADSSTLSGVLVDPATGVPPVTGSPAANYVFVPGTGPILAGTATIPVVTPVTTTSGGGGGGGGGGGSSANACIISAIPKTVTLGSPTLITVQTSLSSIPFVLDGVSRASGTSVKITPTTTKQYTASVGTGTARATCSVVVSVVNAQGELIGNAEASIDNTSASDLTNGTNAEQFTRCGVTPFTKRLKRGSLGPEVLRAQNFLQTQGYDVAATGIFGSNMEQTVKQFQKLYWNEIIKPSKSKGPTGLWYDYTIKKANSLLRCSKIQKPIDIKPAAKNVVTTTKNCKPFIKPLKRGAIGTEVYRVQRFLQSQGFDTPAVGVFGPRMESAIKQFQALYAGAILKPTNAAVPTGLWYEFSMKKANELTGCVYQR